MYVVPDSNILFKDFLVAGPQWRLLREQARRGQFKLAVPEVVIAETVNNYRRELKSRQSKLRTAVEKHGGQLAELGVTDLTLETAIDRDKAVAAYEGLLRTRLGEAGAELPSIPSPQHGELVERAIARRQPFKEEDSGYRDCLIWINVLGLASEDEVALISDDKDAFAGEQPDQLGEALLNDLEVRKLPVERVTLFPALRPFIDAHVPRSERLLHELQERLRTDASFDQAVRRQVEAAVAVHSFGSQDEIVLPADGDKGTAHVEDVTVPEISIDSVAGVEGEQLLLDLDATVGTWIQFSVPKEALAVAEPVELGVHVIDSNHTDLHALVEASRSFSVQLVGSYDEGTEQIDGVEVVFAHD